MTTTQCECAYCGSTNADTSIPAVDDDCAWAGIAKLHAAGCEWVETRAHRMTPLAPSKCNYFLTDGDGILEERSMTEAQFEVAQQIAKDATDGNLGWVHAFPLDTRKAQGGGYGITRDANELWTRVKVAEAQKLQLAHNAAPEADLDRVWGYSEPQD